MVDIQSATAGIRRGKKEEERRRKKPQGKNIMACPIPEGGYKEETTGQKCNVRICYGVRP